MQTSRRHLSLHGVIPQLLIAQIAGLAFSMTVLLGFASTGVSSGTGWALALVVTVQALVAALTAAAMRAPIRWMVFHLLFCPALLGALNLAVHPYFYGAMFFALLAVFGSATIAHRVPLFLTNRRALAQLDRWLPQGSFSMLDLGAGTGKVLRFVAGRRQNANVTGVEVAPLPFMFAWLRAMTCGYRIAFRDLWSCDLSTHDVVYAYLSPAPMQRLWEKARKEMRSGSLFISNSFSVPGVTPTYVARYGRSHGAVLHIWRMP